MAHIYYTKAFLSAGRPLDSGVYSEGLAYSLTGRGMRV
jgi:hypothetical protein